MPERFLTIKARGGGGPATGASGTPDYPEFRRLSYPAKSCSIDGLRSALASCFGRPVTAIWWSPNEDDAKTTPTPPSRPMLLASRADLAVVRAWTQAIATDKRIVRLLVDHGAHEEAGRAGAAARCEPGSACCPAPATSECIDVCASKCTEAPARAPAACCGPPPGAPPAAQSEWDRAGGAVAEKLYQAAQMSGLAPAATASDGSCCGGAGAACGVGPGDFDTSRAPPAHHKRSAEDAASYTYTGEALRAVALPFGGVGGGCVSLAGDGGLRHWQINNAVNHLAQVPDSFFAVKTVPTSSASEAAAAGPLAAARAAAAAAGAAPAAAVLMCDALYDSTGFTPAPMISDATVPDSSKALLSELPGVDSISLTAKFPTAEVDYTAASVPVKVSTEVVSPFIPLDSKNSQLPAVFFNVSVTNTGSATQTVTVLQSQQNIAGWDGLSEITDEVCNAGYGGNVNNVLELSGVSALDMQTTALDSTAAGNGHVAIGVLTGADLSSRTDGGGAEESKSDGGASPLSVATMAQYDAVSTLWSAFTSAGGIAGGSAGPSPSGKTWNGAVSASFDLAPGASRTVTFFLAWHFPNRYVNWSQQGFGIKDPLNGLWVGLNYANYWPTMSQLIEYLQTNSASLIANTRLFRDTVYNSSLPWQVLDSAAPRAVVLRTPTCMVHNDGQFYAFEGCSSTGGCCPLNCTHVWNYEMALARCFPDLEQSMRNTDLTEQIAPNAIIPSRTTVPLQLRRQWTFWPDYSQIDPSSTAICVDGEIATVLKTYREVRFGASTAWFNAMWPQCKKVLARWMTVVDSEGDGVIHGPQPNTYDCSLYGPNSFLTGLYLAALLAGEAMATLQGDSTSAAAYKARWELGSVNLDKLCFTNGKWYTQVVDPKNPVNELGSGAFVDQLLGQWWAHLLDLGYIVKTPSNVSTAVTNVFNANHRKGFDVKAQHPRVFFDERDSGLYVATWPGSTPPAKPMLYTSEGAWSGLEYAMAGLAMQEGADTVWSTMLADIRGRQDGTRRSPWNEIECGDNYSRPMSGFALLEIAAGQMWDATSQTLSFAPRIGADAFKSIFMTGSAWGSFAQSGPSASMPSGTATVSVAYGTLTLKVLRLASTATSATATVGGKSVAGTASQAGGTLTFTLAAAASIDAGSALTLTLSS